MFEIRDVKIGEGRPKICVELKGSSESELQFQAIIAQSAPADIVEWRVDCFESWNDDAALLRMAKIIRMAIGSKILLYTFRTLEEGGTVKLSSSEYMHVVKAGIDSHLIDIVDVECCVNEYPATELIRYAKEHHVFVFGSTNSMNQMLSTGEIDFRIRYIEMLGADLAKIILRPAGKKDVYKLLTKAYELKDELAFPIALLGCGPEGKYTKTVCEFFGSSVTYAVPDTEDTEEDMSVYRIAELLSALHTEWKKG